MRLSKERKRENKFCRDEDRKLTSRNFACCS